MSRLRHEAGQTVVLFAILLPLFLGLGAITVDIGYWYVVKKTAQDAADAAALAAARELPNDAEARRVAKEYVFANMPDAPEPEIEFPYVPGSVAGGNTGGGAPDYTKIEVTVTHPTGTFFGGFFGLLDPTVSRRAVAERVDGGRNLAIFSHNYHGCSDGLEIDALEARIDGYVHSNGQYDVYSGPPPDALWAQKGSIWRENCVSNLDPEPNGAQYGPGPDFLPLDVFQMMNWPMWFTPAEFGWPACRFSGRTIEVLANRVQITNPDLLIPYAGSIPTGTYCATDTFAISADGRSGTITALAPAIVISGSNLDLDPFANDLLFFTVPNTDTSAENDGSVGQGGNPSCVPSSGIDMELSGGRQDWTGVIFNPCGRINLNTGESRIEGAIIASMVKVTGDRLRLTGTGALAAPVGLAE